MAGWRSVGAVGVAVLVGCSSVPQAPAGEDWHSVSIPGKELTSYRWALKDGRLALHASSEQSASMWRRRVVSQSPAAREISFSWWVPAVLRDASVADAKREDAVVRVMLAFAGDESTLPWRTRALFDLAEALTGERPPYATLMYVWDAHAAHDSVVINPRSDRIRKIVVDGTEAGLSQWRDHRRDFVADFRRAYGEDPGALVAVAVMTDTDNTGTRAEAWYGPIRFH